MKDLRVLLRPCHREGWGQWEALCDGLQAPLEIFFLCYVEGGLCSAQGYDERMI